ncbi:hypothetical protein I79_019644 [Cricetulus griseus]|uniref:Uncharacterized protein n=1 Tax=Cricetulus griseus TaxID=10029 RepID=G3I7Z0_CRIGR|nr:hypothetical protein I79_019644 [Cricetulus griseus]
MEVLPAATSSSHSQRVQTPTPWQSKAQPSGSPHLGARAPSDHRPHRGTRPPA